MNLGATGRKLAWGAFAASSFLSFGSAASAQQINGVPGSPSATQVIDGKQIPALPLPFGGVIKESYKDSKPYWPPAVVPPKGAPNILLIMTDDAGYGSRGADGIALHAVSFHGTVLAHARCAHHRAQPSLGGLRCDRRNVHG